MEDNIRILFEFVNCGKWENFDEENREINGYCKEIFVCEKLFLV